MGIFQIANNSPIPIDLARTHDVQLEMTNGWASQGTQLVPGRVVEPRGVALLHIPVPKTHQRWKVWVNYSDHASPLLRLLIGLRAFGLSISYEPQSYSACSDPVPPR